MRTKTFLEFEIGYILIDSELGISDEAIKIFISSESYDEKTVENY